MSSNLHIAPRPTREETGSGASGVIMESETSSYHVQPKTESPGPNILGPSVGVLWTGMMEKKKRGRPRKYGPDGTVSGLTLSPIPISSSGPSDATDHALQMQARNPNRLMWPGSSEKKKYRNSGPQNLGYWAATSVGKNFTPHVIIVDSGEDVTMKIISFSQQGPRAICILSANGVVSNATLRLPDSSGGTLTYEGRFEILSLSGSFIPMESQGSKSRSGGISVSLASPDGRIVGGSVVGLLIAASPVQVVVGSFLQSRKNKKKTKNLQIDAQPAALDRALASSPAAISAIAKTEREEAPIENIGQNLSSFQRDHWTSVQYVPDGEDSRTHINASLRES